MVPKSKFCDEDFLDDVLKNEIILLTTSLISVSTKYHMQESESDDRCINETQELVPTVAKLHLFKAAILPYLTYCHLTWHFCQVSEKRKLEHTQERGLHAVFRDRKSTYEERLKKANYLFTKEGYRI